MTTIEFSEVRLHNLITHQVGNKSREENISLSAKESVIDDKSRELLLEYFLLPVKVEEVFSFTHSVELEMNEVFSVARQMFGSREHFVEQSQSLARLLYDKSLHPKIKEGKLNVTYFTKVLFDDEYVDAIGIFKSEKDVPFLQMKQGDAVFNIDHQYGFDLKGTDKGCIILNTAGEQGYKLLITDSISKAAEAQYWKDEFLQVKATSNEYHQTNQFLSIARDYINNKLSDEFEVTRTDKIDLLNRSVEYFKSRETFEKDEFEGEVLQDNNIIESFQNFNAFYSKEHEVEVASSFDISPGAVKKQARVFKSVIKLDKNFHIYVHGDKELIEQGTDASGRKFYKIYYKEET